MAQRSFSTNARDLYFLSSCASSPTQAIAESAALAASRSGDWIIEIVKRNELHKFVVLPKRWIVERSIAWLNRCRRLAKDWENLNRKALAFLHLASIRLMLRKLCNPA